MENKSTRSHYRHELKYYLAYTDYLMLSKRLQATMQKDPFAKAMGGEYFIRSMYFDDYNDTSFREKLDGADHRDKFRLRAYNHDYSRIKLERKRKDAGYIRKDSITLTRQEAQRVINRNFVFLLYRNEKFAHELFREFTTRQMMPRVIVDYVREPYVFPYDDVRVTFDKDIRTAFLTTDMFNAELPSYPAVLDNQTVMEVKFNRVLPSYIRELVQSPVSARSAISKYVLCRKYEL